MIKLENVTKVYKGDVVALRDASADIQKGEFVFLVGPSGSGKSTMLRLLNKEEVPEQGRIWVAGKDIGDLNSWKVPYLRRNIGSSSRTSNCFRTRPSTRTSHSRSR
jgi:cell division transport system ATP-binding protein